MTATTSPDEDTLKVPSALHCRPADRGSVEDGNDLLALNLIRHAQAVASKYANGQGACVDDFLANRRQDSGE